MLKFKSVEELKKESQQLAKEYPNLVNFLVYGLSLGGNELYCLKIGKGKTNVVILGFPHSNEPVGGTFSVYYAKNLVKDKKKLEKFTFWIIPCADPDSALLNEPWFTVSYSFFNEAVYLFRNKANQQIAWSFPIEIKKQNKVVYQYKNPPVKTKALIKLLDRIKPNFIFPLHNSEFGGVYHYLSQPAPKLYSKLKHAVLNNKFPLHLGEEEMPYIQKLDTSIFLDGGLEDEFSYRPQTIREIKYGTTPEDYCKNKFGTFSIISELPLFWSKKIFDETKTEKRYSEAVNSVAKFKMNVVEFMKKEVENIENNFWKDYIKYWADLIEKDTRDLSGVTKEKDHLLTQAELFDISVCSRWYALRFAGSLIRAARLEHKKTLESRCIEFISNSLDAIFRGEKIEFANLENALNLQKEIVEIVLQN